jgi:hypothetical protein
MFGKRRPLCCCCYYYRKNEEREGADAHMGREYMGLCRVARQIMELKLETGNRELAYTS